MNLWYLIFWKSLSITIFKLRTSWFWMPESKNPGPFVRLLKDFSIPCSRKLIFNSRVYQTWSFNIELDFFFGKQLVYSSLTHFLHILTSAAASRYLLFQEDCQHTPIFWIFVVRNQISKFRGDALNILVIRDDVKLAQLVRARDCQSRGRRFDSGKNSKNWELKSTWIWGT